MSWNILIADDEMESIVIIKEALSSIDANFIVAHNGREAIEAATANDLDLVIIDIAMPYLNGVEALKVIKMSEPNLPVAVITGIGIEEMKQEAVKAGASIVVDKPFVLSDLTDQLIRLLNIA